MNSYPIPIPTLKTLANDNMVEVQFWHGGVLTQSYHRNQTPTTIMGFPPDLIDRENEVLAKFLSAWGHVRVASFEDLLSLHSAYRQNTMIFSNPLAEDRAPASFKMFPGGATSGETPEVYCLNDHQNDWVWMGNVRTPNPLWHTRSRKGMLYARYDQPSALLRLESTCTRLIGNCGVMSKSVSFISPFPNSGNLIRIGPEGGSSADKLKWL